MHIELRNKVKTVLIENLWPRLNGPGFLCLKPVGEKHYTIYSKDQYNEAELAVIKVTADFQKQMFREGASAHSMSAIWVAGQHDLLDWTAWDR